MKFHNIVLERDGNVFGRRQIESAELFSNKTTRQTVREYAGHLRENLPDGPFAFGAFSANIGEHRNRYVMEWRQAEPMSGMATFLVHGRPALLSILLAGFIPEIDAIVVKATRGTLASLFEDIGLDPGPGLDKIPERPAVIDIRCSDTTALPDLLCAGRHSRCLGLAFFQRAEMCFEAIKAEWRRHCSRMQTRSPKFPQN